VKTNYIGLVGDVGGTHARFALVDGQGHIRHPKTYMAADYRGLTEIVAEYLEKTCGRKRPPRAAVAVAGPVVEGEIVFTNLNWRVSEAELIGAFEFQAAKLLNDFAAQAMAAPVLQADELRTIGPELRGADDAPVVVMGAGTGFGVSGIVRTERGDVPISTEGGHACFAPSDEVEDRLLARLRAKHGRVSIERVLSGPGIYEIYLALAELAQTAPAHADERAVLAAVQAGGDPLAAETLERFCGILGCVAGDLALTFGARGGVYVSGGLAPRMGERLFDGPFRARFEEKGRLSDYTCDIPTYLILHPYAALVGAARALEQLEGAVL
jgi:glucokinase